LVQKPKPAKKRARILLGGPILKPWGGGEQKKRKEEREDKPEEMKEGGQKEEGKGQGGRKQGYTKLNCMSPLEISGDRESV